jgi:spore coat-associated protein N
MDDLRIELERDRPDDGPRRERRRRLATATALAALAFVGIGLSSALFTDTQSISGIDFTTGTVRIGTNPATAALSAGNMAPGDDVFGNVHVTNNGSLAFRYAVTAQATDPDGLGLNTQLRLRAYENVTPAQCTAGIVGGGNLVGGPFTLGTAVNLIGDPTTGNDPGDRPLSATSNEDLCFEVSLPLGTGNAYQGATSSITLSFIAEQTKNN